VVVVVLAVVWQVNYSNQEQRERIEKRYHYEVIMLENRLIYLELKAKILEIKMAWVRIENHVNRMKRWDYED